MNETTDAYVEPAEDSLEFETPEPEAPASAEWPAWLGRFGKLGAKSTDARVYSSGPDVATLLGRLGWRGDTFTEEFAEEVRQIQEENGLPATGRVDKATWNVIVNG